MYSNAPLLKIRRGSIQAASIKYTPYYGGGISRCLHGSHALGEFPQAIGDDDGLDGGLELAARVEELHAA